MAFENRKEARIHKRAPLAEKRKAKIPTFREAALQTYEALKPRWRSGKHTRNWLQIMEKYAIPIIGLTLPLFLYHEPLSYCTSSRCWIAARHYDAGRYSLQRLAGIRL